MESGRVVVFAEPDYMYGIGPLTLRIERIDRTNPTRYDGENWYPVVGMRLTADGRELDRREVLVRGRRLRP